MKRNPVSSTYRNSSPALSLIGALAELRDSGRLSQCQMDVIMVRFFIVDMFIIFTVLIK